jgi:hypothetical protein
VTSGLSHQQARRRAKGLFTFSQRPRSRHPYRFGQTAAVFALITALGACGSVSDAGGADDAGTTVEATAGASSNADAPADVADATETPDAAAGDAPAIVDAQADSKPLCWLPDWSVCPCTHGVQCLSEGETCTNGCGKPCQCNAGSWECSVPAYGEGSCDPTQHYCYYLYSENSDIPKCECIAPYGEPFLQCTGVHGVDESICLTGERTVGGDCSSVVAGVRCPSMDATMFLECGPDHIWRL